MSPEAIERKVERMVDHLDALLMAGELSQADYDGAMGDLDAWARGEYHRRVRRPVSEPPQPD